MAHGQEGASTPLKYYSAPLSESNFLRALLETGAPGIYPGYPPLEGTGGNGWKESNVWTNTSVYPNVTMTAHRMLTLYVSRFWCLPSHKLKYALVK